MLSLAKMVEAALLTRGWHLSKEGLERCRDGLENATADNIIKKALNIDLRHIGVKHLPPDLNKGKVDLIQGPCVVQIQKIRNVSAPKLNEDSGSAPQLLRLQLTDGHGTCFSLVMQHINDISLGTTPGTKLQLKGSVKVNQGYLLLTSTNTRCLGGTVTEMVARWQLQKTLAQHTRQTGGGEGGPPPWVPFGQRNKLKPTTGRNGRTEVKKSLESSEKPKELTEQDKEFEEQRKATIEEVRKAKGQQKTFGGAGGKVGMKGKENQAGGGTHRSNSMDSSKSWNNGTSREEESRTTSRNDANYRTLGDFQANSQDLKQLMNMGFSQEASVNALKKHSGNVNQAIESLLDQNDQSAPPPSRGYDQGAPNRGYDQGAPSRGYAGRSDRDGYAGRSDRDRRPDTGRRGGGRMGGRGRGRPQDGDEDGDVSAAPSGPSTLFDFLESKLPKDKSKGKGSSGERRNYANEQPKSVKDAGIKFHHSGKDDSSSDNRGQRNQGDRDFGNRGGRFQDGRDDRTRDGQRNRSDGPKGNRDSFKSGPGRGSYDDRPPRFRNSSQQQDGNKPRNQDKYERPDRSKRQDDTDRQRTGRNFDSRNNQTYEDKRSRNYDDRGGGRKFDDGGRKPYDDKRGRNSEDRSRNYDDRNRKFDSEDRRDNRGNDYRNYNNDRPNQNKFDNRNRTRDQRPDQNQQQQSSSSQRVPNNTDSNKPNNKYTQDKYVPVNKITSNKQYPQSQNHQPQNHQSQNKFTRNDANGSMRPEEMGNNQSMNGTTSPLHQQQLLQQQQQHHQQQPPPPPVMAMPPMSQPPMISQTVTMIPPSHALPVQPLPGQPPPPMVSGQMMAPPPMPPQGIMWKQGDLVQAKYWEDGKFYNAVVTGIHPSGRTVVVNFMEYGNFEEVDANDVRPAAQQWIDTSQPPPPFQPPVTMAVPMVYENFEGPLGDTMEFRRGGQGSYRRPREDRRIPNRPTQNYYQPPTVRR